VTSLAAVDQALIQTRERLMAADAMNDQLSVDVIWIRLDELLDLRLHLPQQRNTTEAT
jgi:hypothetical protein